VADAGELGEEDSNPQ